MKKYVLVVAAMLAIQLQAQRVGIGTSTPAARLDVAGTDG